MNVLPIRVVAENPEGRAYKSVLAIIRTTVAVCDGPIAGTIAIRGGVDHFSWPGASESMVWAISVASRHSVAGKAQETQPNVGDPRVSERRGYTELGTTVMLSSSERALR